MNARRLKMPFFLVFILTFFITFPFHYLKENAANLVSKYSRGGVTMYAGHLGFGLGGLTFDDVDVTLKDLKQNVELESISVLPSLSAIFHFALGVSLGVDGLYGGEAAVVAGRGLRKFYISFDAEDIQLKELPQEVPMGNSPLTLPQFEGNLEANGTLNVDNVGLPMSGDGDISINIPKLSIPKKFTLSLPSQGVSLNLPAIPAFSPGLKGKMTLKGSTMTFNDLKIGKEGQSLWGTIKGTMQTDRRQNLDLQIELNFGPTLMENPSIKNLVTFPLIASLVKNGNQIAVRLTGPVSALRHQPL